MYLKAFKLNSWPPVYNDYTVCCVIKLSWLLENYGTQSRRIGYIHV